MGNQKARKFVSAILAAGLVLPVASLAAAPNHAGNDAVSVSYSDLNIHSTSGAKTLYVRLQKATEEFCDVESYTVVRSLSAHADARACYATTLSEVVDRIDSSALKNIHES